MPFIKYYSPLLTFTVISGSGYGALAAVSYPSFLSIVPKGNTAGFVGLYAACQNGSLLLGPFIAGVLIDSFGYGALYYGAAVIMFLGTIIYMTVRNPEKLVELYVHTETVNPKFSI